jgi:transcriptional regulator with XRE-family HTH domain
VIPAARWGFLDQIREAAKSSGLSYYHLGNRAGIDKAGVYRFANGKAGLPMENLDRLADAPELQVVVRRERIRTRG